jgi:hypothetical protein
MTKTVIKIMQDFSNEAITQEELIIKLETVNVADLYATEDNQTIISYAISYVNPALCDVLIDALLRRAMANRKLFTYLLTTPDENGLPPYYQALNTLYRADSTAKNLSSWLTFAVSMKFITKTDYANLHLVNTYHAQFPLHTLILQDNAERLAMALEELQTAVSNGWLSSEQFIECFHNQNAKGYRAIDAALCSGNSQIIELMIKYAGIHAFSPNIVGYTPLQQLVSRGEEDQLEQCFIALNNAIQNNQIPASIYSSILFTISHHRSREYYLLSVSLHSNNRETSQIILKHAEIAREQNWISANDYQKFLLHHPSADMKFSYLHEALRSYSYTNVYAYVGTCLRAILNGDLSFDAFKEELLKTNNAGYSVFQQAINNEYLQTAELFMNLFHTILPKHYKEALCQSYKRKLYCSSEKSHSVEVNNLLTRERTRVRGQRSLPDESMIHVGKARCFSDEFRKLIKSMRLVARQQNLQHLSASSTSQNLGIEFTQNGTPTSTYAMNFSPVMFRPAQTTVALVEEEDMEYYL